MLAHGEEGRVEVDEGDLVFQFGFEGMESQEVISLNEAQVLVGSFDTFEVRSGGGGVHAYIVCLLPT